MSALLPYVLGFRHLHTATSANRRFLGHSYSAVLGKKVPPPRSARETAPEAPRRLAICVNVAPLLQQYDACPFGRVLRCSCSYGVKRTSWR